MAQQKKAREQEPGVEVLERHQVPDQKLVEETVTWIRQALARTLDKGVTEIGEHVLKTFFGDDPERASSHSPNKNASFRMLTERCGTVDLPISKSFLQRAVGVAVMRRQLPEGATAYLQLPPSHQAELLPLQDPKRVEALAEKAVSKKMSVRDLRGRVAKELGSREPDGRGRKPRPLVLTVLVRSEKLFTQESGRMSFTKAHLDQLSTTDARSALKTARRLSESLNKLIEQLEQH